jgi:hypothetical protein
MIQEIFLDIDFNRIVFFNYPEILNLFGRHIDDAPLRKKWARFFGAFKHEKISCPGNPDFHACVNCRL